jgi:dynein heavy chain
MGQPGGGRQDIPNRLKRHFFIFNLILPSTAAINEIYGQMMKGRFVNNSPAILQVVEALPNTTVKLWAWMRTKMLPSPTKFHYTFNLRDLSRVFQGILRTPKASLKNSKALLLLWRHESERVFSDKLVNLEDKAQFLEQLNTCTHEMLASFINPNNDDGGSVRSGSSVMSGGSGAAKFGAKNQKKSVSAHKKVVDLDVFPTAEELFKGEEIFFTDFMRDDEYDDDGVLVSEAPKVYELGGHLPDLRIR